MRVRRRKIEHLVEQVLKDWQVKRPPVPVKKIAQRLDLDLQFYSFDKEEFSGILVREGKKSVLGVNASHHPNRQRFTIAHEIGHFLLHEGDRVFVDRSYNVSLRSSTSSLGTDVEEIEANTFASLLLIPERFLSKDLEASELDLEDKIAIAHLARRYRVSAQAMTLRLINRSQWMDSEK